VPLPSHEPLDAIAGGVDLLHRGRVAGAHVPDTPPTERVPRDDHDLLLLEEAFAELVVGQPRGGDVGEAVERAARPIALKRSYIRRRRWSYSATIR
jgi:hypothetical protein